MWENKYLMYVTSNFNRPVLECTINNRHILDNVKTILQLSSLGSLSIVTALHGHVDQLLIVGKSYHPLSVFEGGTAPAIDRKSVV